MPGGLGLPNGWGKAHDFFLAELEGMGDYDLEEMVLHLREKFPELRQVSEDSVFEDFVTTR